MRGVGQRDELIQTWGVIIRYAKGQERECQDADIKGLKAGSWERQRGLLVGGSGYIKVQEGMWRRWR